MKITESTIQSVIMGWCMNHKKHNLIIPNSTSVFPWESDLISVTKSGYVHEYEIKLNIYDFNADAKKTKHYRIVNEKNPPLINIRNSCYYNPLNYFWYVTYNFDIVPPDRYGWILVKVNLKNDFEVIVKKDAPRLSSKKISQDKILQIARLLSWRVMNNYADKYIRQGYYEEK
jgi:hypothetical protein